MIIKPIEAIEEIKFVSEVEIETWGMQPGDSVPGDVLASIARNGGLLLGAYEDGKLIGFTLGWLGTIDSSSLEPAAGRLKLVSYATGVLAQYRDRRVGYQLKLAQRDWALGQGLDLITWTFNPLESRNGYFNIRMLGCVCDTYLRDYYGEMNDQMNEGILSDRFRVDWRIRTLGVKGTLKANEGLRKNNDPGLTIPHQPAKTQDGLIKPTPHIGEHNKSPMLIEIPSDFQSIRRADLILAKDWRIHTRDVFEDCFDRGYKVVDFIYQRSPEPRSFYLLERTHEN